LDASWDEKHAAMRVPAVAVLVHGRVARPKAVPIFESALLIRKGIRVA